MTTFWEQGRAQFTAEHGQRPRDTYPLSYAYVEQPACRQIAAGALLLAYTQVHILELLCEGATRGAAIRGAFLLWNRLAPPSRQRPDPIPPGQFTRTNCLAESAARSAEVLELDWRTFKLGTSDHTGPPVTRLHPDDRATLLWLLETVRRVAYGGALLEAARGAYDAHLGKPRQRRQPVAREWLHGEIARTLSHVWWALLHAKLTEGSARAGTLWLYQHTDEDQRPGWSLDQQEGV
jgi:hypothetical protein